MPQASPPCVNGEPLPGLCRTVGAEHPGLTSWAIFCRPWRDLSDGWGGTPRTHVLGYFLPSLAGLVGRLGRNTQDSRPGLFSAVPGGTCRTVGAEHPGLTSWAIFCRPWRDLSDGWGGTPRTHVLGYFLPSLAGLVGRLGRNTQDSRPGLFSAVPGGTCRTVGAEHPGLTSWAI